jgi:hypothetical protein
MHTVTWIVGKKLETISSPKLSAVYRVYHAMLIKGYPVRMWRNGKELVL